MEYISTSMLLLLIAHMAKPAFSKLSQEDPNDALSTLRFVAIPILLISLVSLKFFCFYHFPHKSELSLPINLLFHKLFVLLNLYFLSSIF